MWILPILINAYHPQFMMWSIAYIWLLTTLLLFFCWDGAAHFNGIEAKKDETLGSKIMNRVYFATVTMSTLGYGDISPKSPVARIIVMCTVIVSINIMFLTLHKVGSGGGGGGGGQ
jgi:voltage-gated potassium channel